MITFVSNGFAGSISDKQITLQSGYLEKIDPYCSIMADKGFKISDECAARSINVIVPPGKLGHAQMLPEESW